MEPFVRRFIRASLVWLGVGVVLGVAMAVWPHHAMIYRPAHAHANLLGFVSMMIFGVAYHVIPRFTGRPLHNRGLAGLHLWLANLGLGLLVLAWIAPALPGSRALLGGGALLAGLGAFTFIYNIWRTLGDGRPAPVPLEMRGAATRVGTAPNVSARGRGSR